MPLTSTMKPRMECLQALESRVLLLISLIGWFVYFIYIFYPAGPVEMDLEQLMKYKDKAVGGLTSGVEGLLKKNKVISSLLLLIIKTSSLLNHVWTCHHLHTPHL